MGAVLVAFVAIALILIGLLLWAVRPARVNFKTTDEVIEVLSAPRDYSRLPQILLALKASDTEFLIERKFDKLARRLRAERRKIALQFLDCLEIDYRMLIESSRVLAAMAPEVLPSQEWQRLRLSIRFGWNCLLLRLKLRTGLDPWNGFSQLSDMASLMSYRLDGAIRRISERAVLATEFSSLLEDGSGAPR
jgi:hypothetical protein